MISRYRDESCGVFVRFFRARRFKARTLLMKIDLLFLTVALAILMACITTLTMVSKWL
jgi:hypothetical protein